ncbi:MAG TPA: DUF177 domain-containing protein [Polyangia bacterium]|jgi:uncharacterized protein|nr:DUF177 domain-containing protein [Polyangia bacterium]
MRFKINEIGDGGLPVNVSVTTEWLASACPDLDARPGPAGLVFNGQITPTGDDYLLRGELVGDVEMPCARCLEPALVHVEVPLTVTFVPAGAEDVDPDDEDGDADPDVVTFKGAELDLSGELRDGLVLAVPFNPLCDEACRGLCPLCGGNRNLVPCKHAAAPAAAPGGLAALSKIKL